MKRSWIFGKLKESILPVLKKCTPGQINPCPMLLQPWLHEGRHIWSWKEATNDDKALFEADVCSLL